MEDKEEEAEAVASTLLIADSSRRINLSVRRSSQRRRNLSQRKSRTWTVKTMSRSVMILLSAEVCLFDLIDEYAIFARYKIRSVFRIEYCRVNIQRK